MAENQYSIGQTIDMFLENIALSRSENTERTYRNAMNAFKDMLSDKKISTDQSINALSEKIFSDYAKYLKAYSSSKTEPENPAYACRNFPNGILKASLIML